MQPQPALAAPREAEPGLGSRRLRATVIGTTVVLAVAIGAVVATFLVGARGGALGPSASYVPADAAMYVEWRVVPSTTQDAALRQVLGRFPIPDFDAETPLADHLTAWFDEQLTADGVDLSWEADVAAWFDGHVAFAATESSALLTTDPTGTAMPRGLLAVAGVTDAAAARATAERVLGAYAPTRTTSEHAGITIWSWDAADGPGALAITDDALLLSDAPESIVAALDRRADPATSLAGADAVVRMASALPEDRLGLVVWNAEAFLAAMRDEAGAIAPGMAPLFELAAGQPTLGVVAFSAAGDRLIVDTVSSAPTGDFALENSDRRLAEQVPADAVLFADAGGVGPALARTLEALTTGLADVPGAAEGIGQLEAALGGRVEEMVAWVDDAGFVAGWDGEQPYGGLILVPSDGAEAVGRVDSLLSLLRLATLDPSSGIAISEEAVAGAEVTTVRMGLPMDPGGAAPGGGESFVAQIAVSEERVVLGLGDRFVGRVLELDPSQSLGASDRFTAAIAELGGATNAGTEWVDLAAARDTAGAALGQSGLGDMTGLPDWERDVAPWLAPLDRMASVARLDGDRLITRLVFVVE
jgi:hypothetical protein